MSDTAITAFFVTLLLAVVTVIATAAVRTTEPVRCYEDEVIVWTGEAHDKCVPLDNLVRR